MRHSIDFYKVVNAVINTLRQQYDVFYATCGNGGSGIGMFSPNDDWDVIRRDLLSYDRCEELEDEDILNYFDNKLDSDKGDYIFWQLTKLGEQNPATIQIAINPDNYITKSYDLRDMICDDLNLEAAEITTGINGYPSGLRGCVLLCGSGKTIEQMQELTEMYGVELVSLHRRDGWQLWECEGRKDDLYDYAEYMDIRNDNLHWWNTAKAYVDELQEYAEQESDEKRKQEFFDAADKVGGLKLGNNEFLYCSEGYPYLTNPEKADRMVDHFSYDTHNYTLALDCRII